MPHHFTPTFFNPPPSRRGTPLQNTTKGVRPGVPIGYSSFDALPTPFPNPRFPTTTPACKRWERMRTPAAPLSFPGSRVDRPAPRQRLLKIQGPPPILGCSPNTLISKPEALLNCIQRGMRQVQVIETVIEMTGQKCCSFLWCAKGGAIHICEIAACAVGQAVPDSAHALRVHRPYSPPCPPPGPWCTGCAWVV